MRILVDRVNEEENRKRAEDMVQEATLANLASVAENLKVLTTKDQPSAAESHQEEKAVSAAAGESQQSISPQA